MLYSVDPEVYLSVWILVTSKHSWPQSLWGPSRSCLQNIVLLSNSLSSEHSLNCNINHIQVLSENSLLVISDAIYLEVFNSS